MRYRSSEILPVKDYTMSDKIYNVLFLCTGNSARSILAEAILNHIGQGRFRAYSAGSHPTGRVNSYARELLAGQDVDTSTLRSKSWDEFAAPNAPVMDFVFTVCDDAAGETCPVWPGKPVTAHWGIADPAAVAGDDAVKRQATSAAFRLLTRRITLFLSLPLSTLDTISLRDQLNQLGRLTGE